MSAIRELCKGKWFLSQMFSAADPYTRDAGIVVKKIQGKIMVKFKLQK